MIEMSKNLLQFDKKAENGGWRPFQSRPGADVKRTASARGQLTLEGAGNRHGVGGWIRTLRVKPGRHYRVRVKARVEGTDDPLYHVWVRVCWGGFGDVSRRGPDSIPGRVRGGNVTFEGVVGAPEWAQTADVLLMLRWAPKARVKFTETVFESAPAPKPRPVTLAAVYWRPAEASTVEQNVAGFLSMIDRAAKRHAKPDVIVLPESLTAVGVHAENRDEVCHEEGGPVFERFAGAAKRHRVNLAFSLYERAGRGRYVGAWLVDRRGKVAGRYRKTHCPVGEDTAGFMPGDSLPVFDADFGRVAFQICMETGFPEMTRAYVLDGAEVILMPSWNAEVIDVRARARENGVYCVVSGFDVASMVVGRDGEIIAATWKDQGDGVAAATVDLSERLCGPWVGNYPEYMHRMRRGDLYGRLCKR